MFTRRTLLAVLGLSLPAAAAEAAAPRKPRAARKARKGATARRRQPRTAAPPAKG